MNRTLLTLTGLLLAAPLAAQQPSANERKASELLQLSAQKAMAGYETEAAKLAEKAMKLLATKEAPKRERLAFTYNVNDHAENKIVEAQEPQTGIVVIDGPDGKQVLEYISDEDINVDPEGNVSFGWSTQEPGELDQIIELKALGYLGEEDSDGMSWSIAPHGEESDGGAWHSDSDHDVVWMTERGDHHMAPMANGDLHEQLREIQHELESLRHELHALRSEMSGGRRGMQGNRRVMRFPGGEWNMDNNQLHGGKRFQMRMAPGQMQRIELHGMDGLPGRMELHGMHEMPEMMEIHEMLEGMEMGDLHEMHFSGDEMEDFDFDFDFEGHDGAEVHEEVVVIINGEKFTGDAARKKLKELNVDIKGAVEGKVRMKMMGHGGAFPTPPEPPKAPQQNRWRSKGHDHEDL